MLPRRGCAAAPSSTVAADAAVCERPASWTVEEVRDAEQVEKPLAHEPLPADDRLIFHHGDVRDGTAECGEAQAQEHGCEFAAIRCPRGARQRSADSDQRRAATQRAFTARRTSRSYFASSPTAARARSMASSVRR